MFKVFVNPSAASEILVSFGVFYKLTPLLLLFGNVMKKKG
jgi:hypothetical protein